MENSSLYDLPIEKKIVLCSIVPLSFILKIMQFMLLPDKFFYDSKHIMNLMKSGNLLFKAADSYANTALLFKSINFLNISTLQGWSIAITILMNIFLIFYFLNIQIDTLKDLIVSFCFLGLLNIYVFNISKDIIQFVIFAVVFFILKSSISLNFKIIFISSAFFSESILFRSYYILIMCFFIAAYIIIPKILKKYDKKGIVLLFFILFFALCIFLEVCKIWKTNEYEELINVRSSVNAHRIGSSDAKTMITNLIDDKGNHILFIINYFINAFRMLFPIELFTKGLYYYPFCVFQFICTSLLIENIIGFNYLNDEQKIALYIMLAYYLASFLFEPDFGSFVRHETATMPILVIAIFSVNKNEKKVDE